LFSTSFIGLGEAAPDAGWTNVLLRGLMEPTGDK
jgi:hypothetical protein